ncbi:MAG: hypothetical protein GY703_20710 [Gammaproteobacteria bacterium]|nr:hypothetical protein [Gammaproteobacteria bacterium]
MGADQQSPSAIPGSLAAEKRDIEPRLARHTLLATNTSSIPLEILSESLEQPERLIGLHFFNPVAKMQLIEIVRGTDTGAEQIERALAFCHLIDRFPLPVSSAPGFLVNRILMPCLMEAVLLVSEGMPVESVDQAALDLGMPMGPLQLADTVGLDICLSVAKHLLSDPGKEIPTPLQLKVAAGQLGRKTGRGFYQYSGKHPKMRSPSRQPGQATDISERLLLRLLNESVVCLQENVVTDSDLLDAGLVLGIGFAPFTGGPLHYIRQTGREQVQKRLHNLEDRYGSRFTANRGWESIVRSGKEGCYPVDSS